MDQSLLQFTVTAFVMLIVVINPVAPGVLGIILAALAAQYVFNGITGYYDSLVNRLSSHRRDKGKPTKGQFAVGCLGLNP